MASFAILPGRSKLAPLAAAVACAALAVFWSAAARDTHAWGWDETMHVGAPAWRLVLAARFVDLSAACDALHDCERYPFVFPVVVALFQSLAGATQASATLLSTSLWCATLWGVFLLARELSDDAWTPWIALALAAASPLALSFAGTLMLEIPATCAIVFALRAWARRDVRNPSFARARDLAAGAWIAVAFFTKFNYGLLLVTALALDELFVLASARRRGELAFELRRAAWTAAIPAAALVWWFVLPLPFAFERAAEHRSAFVAWLGGNQDAAPVDARRRVLNLATSFALNPRMLLVLVVGVVASARHWTRPASRACAIATLVLAAAILAHPFHLPRFTIPIGAAAWPLAALGWASLLPRATAARAATLAAIAAAIAVAPGFDTAWLAERLGILSRDPKTRAYQLEVFASYRELGPTRHVQRHGLPLGEADAFLDLAARAVGRDERVAWLDVTEEVSPAGLQHGLWKRGGDERRALAQLGETSWISIDGADPRWSEGELSAFAQRFDVLVFTEPHNLKGKQDREFFGAYVARLESAGWRRERAGSVDLARPGGASASCAVFTLRRVREE